MRVNKTINKNSTHYCIIKDIVKNGKRTTCVYENIGNIDKLKERAGEKDSFVWLENYVKDLNLLHKQ